MVLARPNRHTLRLFMAAVSVLVTLVAAGGASARAPRRIGTRPVIPVGGRAIGALPPGTRLGLTVTLQPRDPRALANYAQAVSTPGSSIYHHFISVREFAQRFGPTGAQIQAVRASLRAEGLTPGHVAPNGLSIPVEATAGRVAAGLHTAFERYRLPSGRIEYANTQAPEMTGSGASVVAAVLGLDDLSVPRPEGLLRRATRALPSRPDIAAPASANAVSPCAQATADAGTNGAYTADQIASAYGYGNLYGSGDLGAGVTVALYELEPYNAANLTQYQTCYGTSASVTNVSVDGGSSCNGDSYCGIEDVLDIEDVIGLAPQANVLVYEGPNTNSGAYDTYAQMVSDDRAKVISTSWGLCESQEGKTAAASENTLFQEAAAQGQSIFAAAGDNGTTDCTGVGGNPVAKQAVDDPASQPFVTGVGGTKLQAVGPPPTEAVWNDGTNGGAGGGGVSTFWAMPSYQSGSAIPQSAISCGSGGTSCREVPDVSADADENTGYVINWSKPSSTSAGTWTAVGGTSAAAPTWASLAALAEGSSACGGTALGLLNPLLYGAAGNNYSTTFNDITSGNNTYDGITGFSATTGYDMASGLGTPQGSALAATLCQGHDTVTFTTAPNAEQSVAGKAIAPITVAADSSQNENPIVYSASGLPPGLSIAATTGVISGTPTRPGNFGVTVAASDEYNATSTTSFTWTVTAPAIAVSGVPSSVTVTVGKPAVISLSASDSAGVPVTFAAVGLPAGLSINPTTGVISGSPSKASRRAVGVTVSDRYGASSAASFELTVTGRSSAAERSFTLARQTAGFSLLLRAGRYAPRLKSIELTVPAGSSFRGGKAMLRRTVRLEALGGSELSATAVRLRGRQLFVRFRQAVSPAILRVIGPELVLRPALASALERQSRSLKLVALLRDASGTRTRRVVRLRFR